MDMNAPPSVMYPSPGGQGQGQQGMAPVMYPSPEGQGQGQQGMAPVMYPSPGGQGQGQQGIAPQQQIMIVQQAPESPLDISDTKSGCFVGLGATQLIAGILSILFNIGAIVSMSTVTLYAAPGIWCGILFILAGAFGIAGGKRKSKAMVVTFLVLSIISAFASVVVFSIASASVALDQDDYWEYYDGDQEGAIACDAILVVLGLVELVIAIVSSAICCGAICCAQRTATIHYVNPSTGQTYVVPPGAVVMQPAGGAVPQSSYTTQSHQWPASQGPPQALPGGYQPHGPPPYQQQPIKQDLGAVPGVTATHPAMHNPPPYNMPSDPPHL